MVDLGPIRRALVATSVFALSITACATGQGSPSPAETAASSAGGGEPTSVQVTLQEWAVVPAANSAPAGSVTFQVMNVGPEDVHEFVILRTDLDPGALPTDDTGAVAEEEEGIEVVDEVEDIPVAETQQLTVTLEPGKYVLLCNIYDETEKEAHYKMGMRIGFTVTG